MVHFNRIVVIILWILLLVASLFVALDPIRALEAAQGWLAGWSADLTTWKMDNPTNFLIAQIAFGVGAVVLFALLLWMQFSTLRRRGVRIYTADGGSAVLDTDSVGRRLSWHLDQVAEVITVVPQIKPRGAGVDVRLEIEAAPDVDIPMKTDEVVAVTREIIEGELGLRLGKLDVHMRTAPFNAGY